MREFGEEHDATMPAAATTTANRRASRPITRRCPPRTYDWPPGMPRTWQRRLHTGDSNSPLVRRLPQLTPIDRPKTLNRGLTRHTRMNQSLSLIHISEPTRQAEI